MPLTIPSNVASLEAEHKTLKKELAKNEKHCSAIKNAIESIVAKAVVEAAGASNANTRHGGEGDDESTTVNTSLESIKDISVTDDEEEVIEDNEEVIEDIRGLSKFLALVDEGKIKYSESDNMMKELNKLSLESDAANKLASDLKERLVSLESTLKTLKNDVHDIRQYLKRDNLLLHKFNLPKNRNMSSLEFCHFIAQQINYFLPQLAVPVSWEHISDAHPLRTKSRKSNVIVVRFCNRNIRNEIYNNREFLRNGLLITEHLTEENLQVLYKAKELFGYNNVFTEKCMIFITVNGKSKRVRSIQDVNEVFESQAGNIQPHDSTAVDHNKPYSSSRSSRSYVGYVTNSNSNRNHISDRNYHYKRQTGHQFRGHPHGSYSEGYRSRAPYSVYNR